MIVTFVNFPNHKNGPRSYEKMLGFSRTQGEPESPPPKPESIGVKSSPLFVKPNAEVFRPIAAAPSNTRKTSKIPMPTVRVVNSKEIQRKNGAANGLHL